MTDHELIGCEAHTFMIETIREIKTMNFELMKSQRSLEHSVVKLTENLNELNRMNVRIDSILEKQELREAAQDNVIASQRDFMNKALGVIAIVVLAVPILAMIVVTMIYH